MKIRVGKLNSLESVKKELARIYRIARRNAGTNLDVQSVSKLASILGNIGKSIESVDMKKRIAKLEELQEEK